MTVRTQAGRFMIDLRHRHEDGHVDRIRLAVPPHLQTRRGAQRYERQVLAELRLGLDPRRPPEKEPTHTTNPNPTTPTAPTLSDYARLYRAEQVARGLKPSLLKNKRGILSGWILPHLGTAPSTRSASATSPSCAWPWSPPAAQDDQQLPHGPLGHDQVVARRARPAAPPCRPGQAARDPRAVFYDPFVRLVRAAASLHREPRLSATKPAPEAAPPAPQTQKRPRRYPYEAVFSGAKGDRTPDLRAASATLSQLSYCPGSPAEAALPLGGRG